MQTNTDNQHTGGIGLAIQGTHFKIFYMQIQQNDEIGRVTQVMVRFESMRNTTF